MIDIDNKIDKQNDKKKYKSMRTKNKKKNQ